MEGPIFTVTESARMCPANMFLPRPHQVMTMAIVACSPFVLPAKAGIHGGAKGVRL